MQKDSEKYQIEAYRKLMWMALLSFIFMYSLMFASLDGLFRNIGENGPLMIAIILTLPMIIIEVILLGGLSRNRTLNLVVVVLSVVVFVMFYLIVSARQIAYIVDNARFRY